jgi:flagellar FliJ protein
MRKFHFRLQSILDLRQKQADQRKLELGAIAQRCDYLRRQIDQRREDRRRTVLSRGGSSADVAFRLAEEAYAQRMDQDVARLQNELAAEEELRIAAAERYREAKQKADVLKRVQTKREQAHREESRRHEQRQLDEVAQRKAYQG